MELCLGLPLEPYEEGRDVYIPQRRTAFNSDKSRNVQCTHGWTFGHLTPWHAVQKEAFVRVSMEDQAKDGVLEGSQVDSQAS